MDVFGSFPNLYMRPRDWQLRTASKNMSKNSYHQTLKKEKERRQEILKRKSEITAESMSRGSAQLELGKLRTRN